MCKLRAKVYPSLVLINFALITARLYSMLITTTYQRRFRAELLTSCKTCTHHLTCRPMPRLYSGEEYLLQWWQQLLVWSLCCFAQWNPWHPCWLARLHWTTLALIWLRSPEALSATFQPLAPACMVTTVQCMSMYMSQEAIWYEANMHMLRITTASSSFSIMTDQGMRAIAVQQAHELISCQTCSLYCSCATALYS